MKRSTETLPVRSDEAGLEGSAEPVVKLRHPWRAAGIVIVLLLVAMLVNAVITQPGFQWDVVRHYMFAPAVLSGVLTTLYLTVACMAVGILLGLVIALCRLSPNPLLRNIAGVYVAFFRAVPALVQMIFWFNLASLFPTLSIGIPFGPSFVHFSATDAIDPFRAAVLGLGLCEAAFMAEIFRGGIASTPMGQYDAAAALGLRRMAIMRHVVLPQAMKTVIPPTGNEVIGMLKYTSLASVISVTELLGSVTNIYNRTFETMPLLMVAAIWYTVIVLLLTLGQTRLERRFGRGVTRRTTKSSGRPWYRGDWFKRAPGTVSTAEVGQHAFH